MYTTGPASLEAILEDYGVQPNMRWIKVRQNDLPPMHHHLILILFNDGTIIADFPENINWLGALAYAHVGYER